MRSVYRSPLDVALAGLIAALLLSSGCGSQPGTVSSSPRSGPPAAPVPLGTARLRGSVTITGPIPEMRPAAMLGDPQCAALRKEGAPSETIVSDGEGRLANVVISIGPAAPWATPASSVAITQEGCVYLPHVIVVAPGQTVLIGNGDALMHNVHATGIENPGWNVGMPTKGMGIAKSFEHPGVVKLQCDLHPWMRAYVVVATSPWSAVTGTRGTFDVGNLPARTYTVTAWHETLGTKEQAVTLADGEEKEIAFAFEAPAP